MSQTNKRNKFSYCNNLSNFVLCISPYKTENKNGVHIASVILTFCIAKIQLCYLINQTIGIVQQNTPTLGYSKYIVFVLTVSYESYYPPLFY